MVNISFGTFNKEGNNKKLIEAVELLWDMGYVIIAAAGNNGPMIVNGRITKNYSGRGPTKECVQKPDILAPANGIYSCSNGIKSGYSYVPKSGTSMATPFVTGSAALMMEWGIVRGNDPYLYGEKIKAYLIRGAKHLPGYEQWPNKQAGWGALCLRDSLV